ncbi:hypothetical protein HMN09_00965700 [Mycena chlorophos]|uniref:RlpA-like protein double-psi beta-barrel domain-containing protein n=1 Tax=Mycena chlorophos TaxID=658473 RepID=A0A8H6SII8_MYCCL|nr:hypothetical protein HMN09_00965700 [Mycena chlorophos]
MFCYAAVFALWLVQIALATPLPVPQALERRVTHVGRGTWYDPSGSEGNCGYWDSDSSPVVAISLARYDANNGANCNQASLSSSPSERVSFPRQQWIQITNTANGKVAYGKTRDSCVSCDTSSLDMSPSLFEELAPLSTGEITISWHFMNADWSP